MTDILEELKKLTMATMVEIMPAIMPDDYDELVSSINLVAHKVDWVQIDVMDGKYTDSVSWPYGEHGEHFSQILAEDEGLPHWQDLNFEVDLMVSNPYEEVDKWIHAGVARVVLHWKSLQGGDFKKLIEDLKGLNIEVGIALLPSENFSVIEDVLDKIDFVQFMGIEKVGFQDQEFAEVILENISEFHKEYPEKIISVDGAVDLDTAESLVGVGVTRLVSGSFIFDGVPADNILDLKNLVNKQ